MEAGAATIDFQAATVEASCCLFLDSSIRMMISGEGGTFLKPNTGTTSTTISGLNLDWIECNRLKERKFQIEMY